MYKYILLDFDGTIVDTNELIVLALNETARRFLGRDLAPGELNAILGKYLEDQMRYLSETRYEEMVLFYKEFYYANRDKMTREFAGMKDALSGLKELGCKTAVVSAKGRGGIEHGLALVQMESYIDAIISAYDVENNKPHAEPALKALSELGGNPVEALLVGDSPYDILCGKNAGIKTVLVDWTIFPKQEIMALNPDFYINSPCQLMDIVKGTKY